MQQGARDGTAQNWFVDGATGTFPVTGTVAVSGVGGTVTVALPAGAATEATLATMSALLAKMNANLNDVALTAALQRDLWESGATG